MNISPIIFSQKKSQKSLSELYSKENINNLYQTNSSFLLNKKTLKKDKNLGASLFFIALLSPILTSIYKIYMARNSQISLEFLSKRKAKLQTHQG